MLLRLAVLWTGIIYSCLGLVCKICRHQGLSMVPPSAPRSRFVFNAPSAACVEDEVECAPTEEYCLSAFGYALDSAAQAAQWLHRSPEEGRHWVQKGCVGGASSRRGLRPPTKGSGCTKQVLDLTAARSLPLPRPARPLSLTVCVCNAGDGCNAGGPRSAPLGDDPDAAALPSLPTRLLMLAVTGLLLLG